MTQYLTPEQVLFIHSRLISETGGSHGIRDLGLLLSALGRPQATFEGKDLYIEIFSKAASMMDSLVRNHPFVDGNKRTAITTVVIFLSMNGYQLRAGNEETVRFTLLCAQSILSLEDITNWFKNNCDLTEKY
jgi:death-on-curing protein